MNETEISHTNANPNNLTPDVLIEGFKRLARLSNDIEITSEIETEQYKAIDEMFDYVPELLIAEDLSDEQALVIVNASLTAYLARRKEKELSWDWTRQHHKLYGLLAGYGRNRKMEVSALTPGTRPISVIGLREDSATLDHVIGVPKGPWLFSKSLYLRAHGLPRPFKGYVVDVVNEDAEPLVDIKFL